jgi:hypothetical protein
LKSRAGAQNTIVFGAKFSCIRIFGVPMASSDRTALACPLVNAIVPEQRILLHRIRIMCYEFPLSESRWPADWREDESPRLFEALVYNLPREPGRRSDFLIFTPRNPLKRLDSQK